MKFCLIITLVLVLRYDLVTGECPGFNCTYNGQIFCGHIPCPLPPCDKPLVHTPGDCCEHCPEAPDIQSAEDDVAKKDCPYPCTQAGHHYCYPISCAMPPCVDGRVKPGECCPTCPNGPDCSSPDGHVILWKHWRMVDGKNCTCEMPPGNAVCV